MSLIVVAFLLFIAAVPKQGHAAYNEKAFLALQAQVAGINSFTTTKTACINSISY